jgi:spore coat polysaccharide biosynthesis predicted glycosyltransferase SpsG
MAKDRLPSEKDRLEREKERQKKVRRDYQIKLLEDYAKMKSLQLFSDAVIVAVCPRLSIAVEAMKNSL